MAGGNRRQDDEMSPDFFFVLLKSVYTFFVGELEYCVLACSQKKVA